MAIVPGTHLEIQIRFTYLSQKCMSRIMYEAQGAAFVTADVVQVLEAYWNDIKTVWRALHSTSAAVGTTDELFGRELDGAGGYATYAIPTGERVGTRSAGDDGEWVAPFVDGGIRLTVGTNVTRPGQKRIPFVREADMIGNEFDSAYLTLLDNLAPKFSNFIVLGAPVAAGVLQPVVGGTIVDGIPTIFQDVVGHVVNGDLTSQVSRKKGRGI